MRMSDDAEIMPTSAGGALPRPLSYEPASAAEQLQRNARHNYWALAIEGGVFMAGTAFVYPNTVLPTIAESLGASAWLVSLMPIMMYMGMLLPPVLTAHWIDRMERYMPLLLGTGTVQRLPFLLAGLTLLAGPWVGPKVMLIAVALAPLMSGLFGGIGMTAWQQLIAKTVPEKRRSSMFAIRFIIFCILGTAAGYAVELILEAWPGTKGYGLLHLCAFVLLMISYGIFAMIREPRVPSEGGHAHSLWENLRGMPALVRNDRRFALFLASRLFRNGMFILTPFLAIYAQRVLNRPESYVGQLLIVQMIGAIAGNIVAGYLGDRFGGKLMAQGGLLLFGLIAGWSAFAETNFEFQGIFFLYGFAFFSAEVGAHTLVLELCPRRKGATYLALAALVNLPGMLIAAGIATVLWEQQKNFTGLAIATAIWMLLSVGLLIPVREPRRRLPRPPEEIAA